jgi:hypothetical protein
MADLQLISTAKGKTRYGTAENVCRQARRVLDKNKEEAPCALESPQTMEGSF